MMIKLLWWTPARSHVFVLKFDTGSSLFWLGWPEVSAWSKPKNLHNILSTVRSIKKEFARRRKELCFETLLAWNQSLMVTCETGTCPLPGGSFHKNVEESRCATLKPPPELQPQASGDQTAPISSCLLWTCLDPLGNTFSGWRSRLDAAASQFEILQFLEGSCLDHLRTTLDHPGKQFSMVNWLKRKKTRTNLS